MTAGSRSYWVRAGRVRWALVAGCLLVPALVRAAEGPTDAGRPATESVADASPPKLVADVSTTGTEGDALPPQASADGSLAGVARDASSPKGPAAASAPSAAGEGRRRKTAADSLPGSPTNPGLGLSPEAPPTPPAPGGRAPSFGAPTDRDAWTFAWGGRISGYEQIGIGRKPEDGFPAPSGTILHTPAYSAGRVPFYAGPGGTLNFQYGNQTVKAFASVEASMAGQAWDGYYNAPFGPRIRTAYILISPSAIGDARVRFQLGAFPGNYGAPGQWGWGIFGPVLAIHGYGGTATASWDVSPDTQVYLEYGVAAVPEVDEAFVRGTSSDWSENGLSTIVNHLHAGISYGNKYFAKLHLAQANGRDMRQWLDANTNPPLPAQDGLIRVAALELRRVMDPWGELGVTPVYWGFDKALSVHNGIWWGLDWTAGGREMCRKFLSSQQGVCNGKIVAVSAEYDFSLMRILRFPEPFDGNGRDLRISLAFLPFWVAASSDPNYDNTKGYYLGATFEYVMYSWLSAMFMVFGENRHLAMVDVSSQWHNGTWASHSGTVGLVLHSDWQSQDRIVFAYSRYFYSNFADSNPARPLDRDVFTLGASVAF